VRLSRQSSTHDPSSVSVLGLADIAFAVDPEEGRSTFAGLGAGRRIVGEDHHNRVVGRSSAGDTAAHRLADNTRWTPFFFFTYFF